jgi:hypothetical protein
VLDLVGVTVGVVTRPVVCRMTKIKAAPRPSTNTIKPIAAGKLILSSGSFGFWIGVVLSFLADVLNVRPQTRQRVAFSLNRVPQVGHVFGV